MQEWGPLALEKRSTPKTVVSEPKTCYTILQTFPADTGVASDAADKCSRSTAGEGAKGSEGFRSSARPGLIGFEG